MVELFIYYRVAAVNAEAAQVEVQRFQASLHERHPGLTARLLRRPGEVSGLQTWMETYADSSGADGVSDDFRAEIDRAAQLLSPLIDGPRHIEVFLPLERAERRSPAQASPKRPWFP